MRFVIIGLSIIFFTLSAIITFKISGLPVHIASNQDDWKDVTSESNDVIKKWTENQDTRGTGRINGILFSNWKFGLPPT